MAQQVTSQAQPIIIEGTENRHFRALWNSAASLYQKYFTPYAPKVVLTGVQKIQSYTTPVVETVVDKADNMTESVSKSLSSSVVAVKGLPDTIMTDLREYRIPYLIESKAALIRLQKALKSRLQEAADRAVEGANEVQSRFQSFTTLGKTFYKLALEELLEIRKQGVMCKAEEYVKKVRERWGTQTWDEEHFRPMLMQLYNSYRSEVAAKMENISKFLALPTDRPVTGRDFVNAGAYWASYSTHSTTGFVADKWQIALLFGVNLLDTLLPPEQDKQLMLIPSAASPTADEKEALNRKLNTKQADEMASPAPSTPQPHQEKQQQKKKKKNRSALRTHAQVQEESTEKKDAQEEEAAAEEVKEKAVVEEKEETKESMPMEEAVEQDEEEADEEEPNFEAEPDIEKRLAARKQHRALTLLGVLNTARFRCVLRVRRTYEHVRSLLTADRFNQWNTQYVKPVIRIDVIKMSGDIMGPIHTTLTQFAQSTQERLRLKEHYERLQALMATAQSKVQQAVQTCADWTTPPLQHYLSPVATRVHQWKGQMKEKAATAQAELKEEIDDYVMDPLMRPFWKNTSTMVSEQVETVRSLAARISSFVLDTPITDFVTVPVSSTSHFLHQAGTHTRDNTTRVLTVVAGDMMSFVPVPSSLIHIPTAEEKEQALKEHIGEHFAAAVSSASSSSMATSPSGSAESTTETTEENQTAAQQ
eukprot:TRINITY_DN2981_c0_g1_i1.p1 TRINITY_DN2981_c0_g1~~TRINITY_DN2981_c0_g1_i1.p1  ORF type:complete len:704 (+),score=262.45 TRINITY_DN2981_c0_g1_i1:48-2159(+)